MRYHIRAYGKINLVLKVGPPRPDGYHGLNTVYQTVNLWDDLILTFEKGSDIRVAVINDVLPDGISNLAEQAARQYLLATGWSTALHIDIDKHIPVGGGMGGGSSDAASVLMALNRVCPIPLKSAALMKIAVELGSDVPCFLVGGTVFGEGRGEQVRPLSDAAPFSLLAVMPDVGFSTADMFRQMDRMNGLELEPLEDLDNVLGNPTAALENDFDRAVAAVSPEVHSVMEDIRTMGYPVILSGSGSTFLVAGSDLKDVTGQVPESWQVRVIESKPRHMVSHVPVQ